MTGPDTNGFAPYCDAYPDHPGRDQHPFYHTAPGMSKYRSAYDRIRAYQERYVEKLLSHALPFGNVLYCMNNETSTEPVWGRHWMRFIKARAEQAGVDVYVTDMFDNVWKPEESTALRQAIDQPDLYDFLDVSQVNSRNFGQDHWRRLTWITQQVADHARPRPVNHTKIYSAGQTAFGSGTPQDGIERFWRNLLGGSASSRFHRPTSGIGLNEQSQACIRAARKAESLAPFWNLRPHMELLVQRAENGAYLAARPGQAYVLYLPRGGSVGLNLRATAGNFRLRWIQIASGAWGQTAMISGGETVTLAAPDDGGWVAAIVRTDAQTGAN